MLALALRSVSSVSEGLYLLTDVTVWMLKAWLIAVFPFWVFLRALSAIYVGSKRGGYDGLLRKIPQRPMPDEQWGDMIASLSADELIAGKLMNPEQWDLARRVIAQQIYVSLASNCRPATDLNTAAQPPDDI